MAEPLKLMYDGEFLEQFGGKVHAAWPKFSITDFTKRARREDWDRLELKPRIRRITEALGASLPDDYEEALDILFLIDKECTGFPYLFFPDFVEVFGKEEKHWDRSMEALARFTKRSSSEFAVRPFILEHPERMIPQLLKWADDPNEHVRRLSSEGSRPRLPWGQSLPMFKIDPSPMLPLLTKLKQDPSLYVRKSVANHLNDIVKDHPDLVIELAEQWKGSHPLTDWIVRHACRTLIKRADRRVMSLFGYTSQGGDEEANQLVTEASLSLSQDRVEIGGEIQLRYRIKLAGKPISNDRMKLRIEYGIDFMKSGGKTSLKRFLLSDREYSFGEIAEGLRTHRFANLTTRKHYAGLHVFTLWVNGVEVAKEDLEVIDA
ncbi:DNA alkylation repair protein [Paenibacillus sp. GSMTC-2017]|uniref:DNA alkylation repair protein n=1 Tax=Paenibacillus sp. GSMTC-2017 TaxID=2794350 RepID=UPI0018DA2F83|nr:DNA alkylation repair protein [Paenibacillus sp. GSMTC-2017]MBH5318687.1 DNA alkylation repair protein [Paenibacillus sp. GSMTC-2017]